MVHLSESANPRKLSIPFDKKLIEMIKDIGFDTAQPKDLIESNGVISDISKKKNR